MGDTDIKSIEDYHKNNLSEVSELESWKPFSKDYDEKVYSFTRFKKNRDVILNHIKAGRILSIGTGPTDYLNRELIRVGKVVATDFCPEMLEEARKRFTHPNLKYRLEDSRNLPFEEEFDTVLAINSILPPTREDVVSIYKSGFKATKKGGVFIATLIPLDNTRYLMEAYGKDKWEIDWENKIEIDTNGKQCIHDHHTIYTEMKKAGWKDFDIKVIYLDCKEEIDDIKRLYGYATFEPSPKNGKTLPPWYEFLLIGKK